MRENRFACSSMTTQILVLSAMHMQMRFCLMPGFIRKLLSADFQKGIFRSCFIPSTRWCNGESTASKPPNSLFMWGCANIWKYATGRASLAQIAERSSDGRAYGVLTCFFVRHVSLRHESCSSTGETKSNLKFYSICQVVCSWVRIAPDHLWQTELNPTQTCGIFT